MNKINFRQLKECLTPNDSYTAFKVYFGMYFKRYMHKVIFYDGKKHNMLTVQEAKDLIPADLKCDDLNARKYIESCEFMDKYSVDIEYIDGELCVVNNEWQEEEETDDYYEEEVKTVSKNKKKEKKTMKKTVKQKQGNKTKSSYSEENEEEVYDDDISVELKPRRFKIKKNNPFIADEDEEDEWDDETEWEDDEEIDTTDKLRSVFFN